MNASPCWISGDPRTFMDRDFYHSQRRLAYRLVVESRLIERDMPRSAASDRAAAARYRAEIAAPVDAVERARNQRWQRLHAALRICRNAMRLRQRARALARDAR